MNYDDTQTVPADGSVEAQPESTQTEQAPVTSQQAVTPTLSLQDVERLVSERETKLRAEFDERERRNKSKSDKAYAAALRDAKVIEQNAEILGLNAEDISAAKRKIIDRTFDTAFAEPETPAPQAQPTPTPQPQGAVSPQLTRADILAQLEVDRVKVAELPPETLDALVTKFQGRDRNAGDLIAAWDDELVDVKASLKQQRAQRQQQEQNADRAANIARQYGGVSSPVSGTPSAGSNPEKELESMISREPPDDPSERVKYNQRLQDLYAKVYKSG